MADKIQTSNIFVLTTGRSGSTTFAKACEHMTNFTVGHETRCQELGDKRLAYPPNHIEVDNRLSWFLGRLEKNFGDNAIYVHLIRDPMLVAESYNKRWTYHGSISMAYARGILMSKLFGIAPCQDMVRTITENIEAFLATKSRVYTINILNPEEKFKEFWLSIGAKGDFLKALKEFDYRHNPSISDKDETDYPKFDSEHDKITYETQRIFRIFEKEKSELLEERSKHKAELANTNRELTTARDQLNNIQIKIQETEHKILLLQEGLPQKIGMAIIGNVHNPIGWAKIPTAVISAIISYKKNKHEKSQLIPYKQQSTTPLAHHITTRTNKPSSKSVIWEAAQLIPIRGYNEALDYIYENGTENDIRASNLIKANRDIGDDKKWLEHVNKYHSQFGIMPIRLTSVEKGTSRFSRITASTPYKIKDGPLVTIIVPAFNAAKFLEHSIGSLLNQTWQNIEVIIVDDNSTDNTWAVMQSIASRDPRVKLLRNRINVGPYVTKNRALQIAKGQFITGHDADDWSHPQHTEKHVNAMIERPHIKASHTFLLRVMANGEFTRFMKVGTTSPDGVMRLSSISTLFDTATLREKFGYWDSVRFGADTELISRARKLLDKQFAAFQFSCLFALDHENSLTNHPEHGVSKTSGISTIRQNYRKAWMKWHKDLRLVNAYMNFPPESQKYKVPEEMKVPLEAIKENLKNSK